MKIRQASAAWLLLALGSIVLRTETDMLDPIHEQFHQEAVWMTGGTVVDRGQSHIRHRGSSWPAFVSWAGYGGEVIIFGILALPFRRVGPFYAGLWGIAPFRSVGSVDFDRLGLFADFALWSIWLVLGFWIVCVYYYRYLDEGIEEPIGHKKSGA